MSTGRYTDLFTSCSNSIAFPWWYEGRNSVQFLCFLEKYTIKMSLAILDQWVRTLKQTDFLPFSRAQCSEVGCSPSSQHQHSFTVRTVLLIKNLAVRKILSSQKVWQSETTWETRQRTCLCLSCVELQGAAQNLFAACWEPTALPGSSDCPTIRAGGKCRKQHSHTQHTASTSKQLMPAAHAPLPLSPQVRP